MGKNFYEKYKQIRKHFILQNLMEMVNFNRMIKLIQKTIISIPIIFIEIRIYSKVL